MRYLNLGCGSRFHPDWVNLDIWSSNPYVQICDLRNGISYPDQSFDFVYHSHLLEHFPKHQALDFMKECYRVLKPRGIIRVVVPDLEQITNIYLQSLEKTLKNQTGWQQNYEWMMLELYDQAVREYPGGSMLEYLKHDPIPNEGFIYERVGGEARKIIQALQLESNSDLTNRNHGRTSLLRNRRLSVIIREKLIRMTLGKENYQALQIGRFRLTGEVHQWMYDRYSLARLLVKAGFQNPIQQNAFDSAIDNWQHFNLDTESDGTVYKPDSLFMEAIKPGL